ncbi:MAG: hypothetical protein JJE21_03560 [Spirochaetaceae bacterium]|nr:hypothetical protein [Spirochaetaceae bacterium]
MVHFPWNNPLKPTQKKGRTSKIIDSKAPVEPKRKNGRPKKQKAKIK